MLHSDKKKLRKRATVPVATQSCFKTHSKLLQRLFSLLGCDVYPAQCHIQRLALKSQDMVYNHSRVEEDANALLYTHTRTHTQHKHRWTQCTQTHPHSLSTLTQTESFITTSKSFCFTVSPHIHHTLRSQPTVYVSGGFVCSCMFVWTGCWNQLRILTLLIDDFSYKEEVF